jgi:excisionase family DNA binding protein
MTERLLTPADIAEQCQLSTKTVLRAIRSGRLRACRLGTRGGFRVAAEDLEAWIAASMVAPERHAAQPSTPLSLAAPGSSAVGHLVVSREMGRTAASKPYRSLGQEI